MKLSLVVGSWWLRFHYPDTGLFRWKVSGWNTGGKKYRISDWRRVL